MKYKRKKDKDFWVRARAYLHDYMPAVKNLSDKSVDAYKQSLKTYLSFLKEVKYLTEEKVTLDAFSRDNIKEYVTWLKAHGYSVIPQVLLGGRFRAAWHLYRCMFCQKS